MGEPAESEAPEWPADDNFERIIEDAAKWRRDRGIPELSEDEAMELAVAEVRAYRRERAERYKPS